MSEPIITNPDGTIFKLAKKSLDNTTFPAGVKHPLAQIESLIKNETFEEFAPPNNKSKDNTVCLMTELKNKNIFPNSIRTSCEGGVCLVFSVPNRNMYVELYNDGDSGYTIEDCATGKAIENVNANILTIFGRVISFLGEKP